MSLYAGTNLGPYERTPNYDVTRDGQRFLMVKPPAGNAAAAQLNVVLNWHEELKRLVPTTR